MVSSRWPHTLDLLKKKEPISSPWTVVPGKILFPGSYLILPKTPSRTGKSLRFLHYSFMAAGRRHEIPESETNDFITHGTASNFWLSLIPV